METEAPTTIAANAGPATGALILILFAAAARQVWQFWRHRRLEVTPFCGRFRSWVCLGSSSIGPDKVCGRLDRRYGQHQRHDGPRLGRGHLRLVPLLRGPSPAL